MTVPRVLARSVVSRAKLSSTMRAELQAVDVLFADNGPFGPDRKFPHWRFTDLDIAIPTANPDVLSLGIPVLYGELSDEGATDPITTDPISKGLIPGFYLGKFAIGDALGGGTFQFRAVAGGGGEGASGLAGGGGGGSVINGTRTIALASFTVTVGAHGTTGVNGSDTVFDGDTAPGGGHGGQDGNPGADGGNGGGAGGAENVSPGDGDLGNANDWQSFPPGNGTFGHPGGTDHINAGGGGGGAGGTGGAATQNNGGNGGPGFASDFRGVLEYLGAGGAGLGITARGTIPDCAFGRGATGANYDPGTPAQDGAVFVRYVTGALDATGGTITTGGGWTIHTFTTSGTFTITVIHDATLPVPPGPSPGRTMAKVVQILQASVDALTTVADWGAVIGTANAEALEALGTVPTTYTTLASVIGIPAVDAMLAGGETDPDDELTGNIWGFIAYGLGAWYRYLGVYASDLGGGVAEMRHDRTKMDMTTRDGVDLLVPGFPSWPYSLPYVQFVNSEGQLFNITGVFARGPILKDHINGVVNIAVNAIGIEDVGDGTGLPIVEAHKVEQHLIENHFIRQSRGGPWVTSSDFPVFEDGTPMVKSSTFSTRQAQTADSIGGLGLVGAFYSDTDQRGTTDWLADWMAWTESKTGINGDGQVIKFGIDPAVDTSAWPRIEHIVSVFGGLERNSGEDRENVGQGSCDYDPDSGKFRTGPVTRTNDAAIKRWKNRRRVGDPHENKFVRLTSLLHWVLDRRLVRLGVGSILVDVSGPIGWLDYDIGDGVLFNSEDGPGPEGYVDQPMIIVRRKFDLAGRKVSYTLWDVKDVLINTAILDA